MFQNNELLLRSINKLDFPFLKILYRSTREHELTAFGFSEEQKVHFIALQFEAQDSYYRESYSNATFDVVLQKDTPIGRLYLDEWEDQFRIVDIALLPDFCGQGIGSYLLRNVMDNASAVGKGVSIHVEQNNPALRLYERLGFEKVGEHGFYDLMEWRAN